MGLDTTHDCWRGSYTAFASWRKEIARIIGIDIQRMEGFGGSEPWPPASVEPLVHLLHHSDCDGTLELPVLLPLAKRLREVAPILQMSGVEGFDQARAAIRFAQGCEKAYAKKQPVEFH